MCAGPTSTPSRERRLRFTVRTPEQPSLGARRRWTRYEALSRPCNEGPRSRCGGEHASNSPPLAALLAAGIASVAGDREKAARSLRTAIELGRRTEMSLQAEAARYQLGRLLGGDDGRALVESARLALEARGVRSPVRFVSMMVPGRFEPPVIAAPTSGGSREAALEGG